MCCCCCVDDIGVSCDNDVDCYIVLVVVVGYDMYVVDGVYVVTVVGVVDACVGVAGVGVVFVGFCVVCAVAVSDTMLLC